MVAFGRIACWVAGVGAAVTTLAGSVAAQSVEQFYRGRTMTILIGHPPGGSYDLYARLAADHMGKFIPGHPNIIVQSKPGGGSAVASAYLYGIAPRDGSMLGLFAETIAATQVLDPQLGKWKMQEMTYIGSFAGVNAAFVRRKDSPAKTVEDMRNIAMNVGCSGRTSQSYQSPALLKNLGGFKFNLICGYPGSAEYVLAMEKGEVDMVSSAWNQWISAHPQKIKDGEFVPVIQSGLKRHPDLPDIPLMQELVSDPKVKQAIEFASAGAAIGRAIIAPPKVPQDRIDALRAAFDKVVEDPAFLADAKKRLAEIDPSPGDEVQQAALAIVNAPKDVVELAAKGME
ncbi:MAG: Bug family tripartite tricarboxylate transporter substrate binding protein [Gemmatimonas sp.]